MTLEEVIRYHEEIAEEYQRVVDTGIVSADVTIDMLYCGDTEVIEEHLANYHRCASENRQITEWLKKLQAYEEGIEKIKEQVNNFKGCDMWDTADGMELALELLEVKDEENNTNM